VFGRQRVVARIKTLLVVGRRLSAALNGGAAHMPTDNTRGAARTLRSAQRAYEKQRCQPAASGPSFRDREHPLLGYVLTVAIFVAAVVIIGAIAGRGGTSNAPHVYAPGGNAYVEAEC
jgi:hypothetical protein